MSTSKPAPADLVTELEEREETVQSTQERVEEFGEAELQELADAHHAFREMLEIYQDQVTGDDGDIKTIIEFQSRIDEVMSEISRSVLLYETFEECDEYLQQKWFSNSDFEHVYEQLEPIEDLVARLDDRDDALAAYRETRKDVTYRCRDLNDELDDLERLAGLVDAELDAPTERLSNPIEAYNDAVTTAFNEFRKQSSARTLLRFLQRMEYHPLIEFESPPTELADYITENPPGEEPLPKLLEYAGYSQSKLDHYVDEPTKLKHAVEHHRAYLDRLDASPLRIDWPPPKATELHWHCEELTAAVNRIDPAVVEQLRTVAALPRTTDYDRLRTSAVVTQELSDDERKRLKSGDIEAELEATREEYERLQAALEEYPER